jgi:hypothetical protein
MVERKFYFLTISALVVIKNLKLDLILPQIGQPSSSFKNISKQGVQSNDQLLWATTIKSQTGIFPIDPGKENTERMYWIAAAYNLRSEVGRILQISNFISYVEIYTTDLSVPIDLVFTKAIFKSIQLPTLGDRPIVSLEECCFVTKLTDSQCHPLAFPAQVYPTLWGLASSLNDDAPQVPSPTEHRKWIPDEKFEW